MNPLLVLNFKAFASSTSRNAVHLARVVEAFARKNKKLRVVVCPSFTDLPSVAKVCSQCQVFSQHVDPVEFGSFTGSIPVSLAANYASGTILNHAEHKISFSILRETISLCKKYKLQTLVCADSIAEAKKVSCLSPSFVAIEPPDLIGSGVSVSTSRPQVVQNGVEAVKKVDKNLPVLVGAGVSTAADVAKSLELGADGVLVASAFAKNKDPKKWLAALKTH